MCVRLLTIPTTQFVSDKLQNVISSRFSTLNLPRLPQSDIGMMVHHVVCDASQLRVAEPCVLIDVLNYFRLRTLLDYFRNSFFAASKNQCSHVHYILHVTTIAAQHNIKGASSWKVRHAPTDPNPTLPQPHFTPSTQCTARNRFTFFVDVA